MQAIGANNQIAGKPVSLLGQKLSQLRAAIFARLPERPQLFPEDQLTDQTERALVGEIIREKLMRRLRRLFHRAGPDPEEVNILRGILSAAQGRKSMRRED